MRRLPAALTGSRVIAAALLASIGLLTWWWLSEQRSDMPTAVAQRHPDSYFHGLDVLRHNAAGEPEMRVEARYAEHFANEAWIHLRELRATGLRSEQDWRLVAQNGRLSDDGVHLEVWNDVVLTRGGRDGEPIRLQTRTLHVNTDTEVATTDASVVISQGAGRLSGRGLWASLADDRLRLEENVAAYYEK